MNELTTGERFSLTPQSLDEAMRFAEILSESTIVPKDFARNPGNILVAIQWGMELGLQPMQAMQNIAVINGRPALWGDAVIALVRSSPLCEYIYESDDGSTATIRVKRRGEEEQIRTFSMEDAQKAGLQGKSGPWTQYPKRMRQMRARAFALRDVFPDVLRGMPIAEEVMDTPAERDITPRPQPAQKAPAALPDYTDAQMQENKAAWREAIQAGKTRAERIISMVSSKYTLTDSQKQAIRNLEPLEPEKDAFVADMERAEQEQDQ
ncbi:recombinase RecT [Castellaniella ginsengisoli]|uniref:Recombinase RecT n=1 Tax=Castellaniella ginsengisoli TaxID=546114 RepID=A0AB39G3S7_9BURK